GSKEGQDYWKAMCCGANFAWNNRQLITFGVRNAFADVLGRAADALGMGIVYDVCHNIGKVEEHVAAGGRRKVVVHRKGATRAFPAGHPETPATYRDVGQPVLIPGDMGTCSFVLVGQPAAMEQSFGSSCHGAGRQMSRKAATRAYSPSEVLQSLERRGIYVHAASRAGIVEEAPGAYKNVEDVRRGRESPGERAGRPRPRRDRCRPLRRGPQLRVRSRDNPRSFCGNLDRSIRERRTGEADGTIRQDGDP